MSRPVLDQMATDYQASQHSQTSSITLESAMRNLKRRYTDSSSSSSHSTTSMIPPYPPRSHYPQAASQIASSQPPAKFQATRSISSSRNHAPAPTQLPSLDPMPGDDDAIFIRPPFTDFPDSHKYPEGLTFNVLEDHPNWFLDQNDFITVDGKDTGRVKYPVALEPPRGWCVVKKKDIKDGWPEGQVPKLRCTMCRRTYCGQNAKSMWRRHVFEKHRVAMSNRRENSERKGRGSNKENKGESSRASDKNTARGAAKVEAEKGSSSRASSLKPKQRSRSEILEDWGIKSKNRDADRQEEEDDHEEESSIKLTYPGGLKDENELFNVSASSSTPPLTPGASSSPTRMEKVVIPESPYNPLLTPSFRHSPARLPSDQPWRYPSPSHPLHSRRELSLCMLVRGEASPVVSGLDVSPVVIVPASERGKRSIFGSPFGSVASKKDSDILDSAKGYPKPSPRRLFSDASLPTPLTERLKFKKPRVPESPLSQSFTPNKSKPVSLGQFNSAWRTPLFSPLKSPGFKSPGKGTGLLGPIQLDGEDPFADNVFKPWTIPRTPSIRPDSPPDSDPECESPVLRSGQLSQEPLSQSSSGTSLGTGLLEGFSLKEPMSDGMDVIDDDLLVIYDRKEVSKLLSPTRPTSSVGLGHSRSPALVLAGKKNKREGSSEEETPDDESEESSEEELQPKKRRRTSGECT